MTFTMLECFCAAVETLNFTVAAQNMHMTQPAFSRNIAALESDLNIQLFIRSKQSGITVTSAGYELYNGVKKLHGDFDLVLKRVGRISRGEQGKLVIGILSGKCVEPYIMNAILAFRQKYPEVELQLMCHDLKDMVDGVAEGRIDVCITLSYIAAGRPELRYMELCQLENYLGVPSSLHCDRNAIHSLAEFKDEYFLLSDDAPELNALLVNACRSAGFEPKTKTAPNFDTKMLWVEFGQGIAIHSNEHYLKDSPYVDFIKVKEIRTDAHAIIWQKENTNPSIPLFCGFCREMLH